MKLPKSTKLQLVTKTSLIRTPNPVKQGVHKVFSPAKRYKWFVKFYSWFLK